MLWPFFWSTLVVGTLTFGGGYAMISALQQDLVVSRAWLTPAEFANGVAVGQVTPGPLMIMIAFLGYKLGGLWGALLGTLGLFLPSFAVTVLLSRQHRKAQASPRMKAALKGINAGVVGLLASAVVSMAKAAFAAPAAVIIALLTLVILVVRRKESIWTLLVSALLGAWLIR